MDIFVYTKFVLSSEFNSDSNALIFSLIERELSELCEFYKLYPKMVIFHAAPSVLQIAVILITYLSHCKGNCLSLFLSLFQLDIR